ncbi:TetR family transcriptional regulator [Streptomyces sp. NPDC060322]|uniref:TetR family transcriptional regulator n=1 Tax=Streptomyces sp. NPDC060322 TaxID=3347097 RepID=UPI00364C07D0
MERGDSYDRGPVVAAPTRDAKLEALALVQKQDGIGAVFSPAALLTLVLSLALAWNPSNATGMSAPTTDAESTDDRRRSIIQAVRHLL